MRQWLNPQKKKKVDAVSGLWRQNRSSPTFSRFSLSRITLISGVSGGERRGPFGRWPWGEGEALVAVEGCGMRAVAAKLS